MENSGPPKSNLTGLAKLEDDYRNAIPEKFKSLQKHIDDMRSSIREDSLANLRMEVHKIAGTAGTFGFPEVSVICKEFEKDLIQKIKEYPDTHGNPEWLVVFDSYLKKIKEGFKL